MNSMPAIPVMNWVSSVIHETLVSVDRVRSNEINEVFRFAFAHQVVFLKLGPNLEQEYEKLQWLEGHLPCPKPLGFTTFAGTDALLMAAVEGEDLSGLAPVLPPAEIIRRLVLALKTLHLTSVVDCPFARSQGGTVLVHGDACLPNFLYHKDCLSGYIDVGDMRIDTPEVDLSAGVWTLQRNLGPGYGLAFLREYGIEGANEADVERLRLMYEQAE